MHAPEKKQTAPLVADKEKEETAGEPRDSDIKTEERNNELENKVNLLFSSNNFENEVFVTYNVFILREGDTLDNILEKYNITEEELKKYNDLSDLKLSDKLIIPSTNYEGN